jgi:hypothetical protein
VPGDLAAGGLTLPQDFVTFRTGVHVRAYIRPARRRGGCRPQSVRGRGIPPSSARRRASWWWPRRRAVPGPVRDRHRRRRRYPARPGGSPALPAALSGEPASAQSHFAQGGFSGGGGGSVSMTAVGGGGGGEVLGVLDPAFMLPRG